MTKSSLSGFCNPSWNVETPWGRESHGRCRKADCPCGCGFGVHQVLEELPVPPGVRVVVSNEVPEGCALIGPRGWTVDRLLEAAAAGDPMVQRIQFINYTDKVVVP